MESMQSLTAVRARLSAARRSRNQNFGVRRQAKRDAALPRTAYDIQGCERISQSGVALRLPAALHKIFAKMTEVYLYHSARRRTPQIAAWRAQDRRALPPAISVAAMLFLLALIVGCASPHHLDTGSNKPFHFETDTFAFPNELTWTYEYDAKGKWTTHTRKPKPDYSQHCFVMARATRQFYLNARFEASQPVADQATYRRLIQKVVSSNPRKGRSDAEKIVIPGYPQSAVIQPGTGEFVESRMRARLAELCSAGALEDSFSF